MSARNKIGVEHRDGFAARLRYSEGHISAQAHVAMHAAGARSHSLALSKMRCSMSWPGVVRRVVEHLEVDPFWGYRARRRNR
jgi:hypothetical protein